MKEKRIRELSRKCALEFIQDWFDSNNLVYDTFDKWRFARNVRERETLRLR